MSESRWTLAWNERPAEEAALYNPAFCGELLARSVVSYEEEVGRAFPFPLVFLILPLVLHPATRDRLPSRSNALLQAWAVEHSSWLVGIGDRALSLRPVAREALMFMAQHGLLRVGGEGVSRAEHFKLPRRVRPDGTSETEASRRAAGFVGRWFARQSSEALVLRALGMRP